MTTTTTVTSTRSKSTVPLTRLTQMTDRPTWTAMASATSWTTTWTAMVSRTMTNSASPSIPAVATLTAMAMVPVTAPKHLRTAAVWLDPMPSHSTQPVRWIPTATESQTSWCPVCRQRVSPRWWRTWTTTTTHGPMPMNWLAEHPARLTLLVSLLTPTATASATLLTRTSTCRSRWSTPRNTWTCS